MKKKLTPEEKAKKYPPSRTAGLKRAWQKGEAPNPKGRPKGVPNKNQILRSLLETHIKIKDMEGKDKTVPVEYALHLRMIKEVLQNGNVAAYRALMEFFGMKEMEEIQTIDITPPQIVINVKK
jgi:hypothetical protein